MLFVVYSSTSAAEVKNTIRSSPSSSLPNQVGSGPKPLNDNTTNNSIVTFPSSDSLSIPQIVGSKNNLQTSTKTATSSNDLTSYTTNSYTVTVQIVATSSPNTNMIQVTATVVSLNNTPLPNKMTVQFYFYTQTDRVVQQTISIKTQGQSSVTTTFLVPILDGSTSYLVDSVVYGQHHLIIGDPKGMLNW
jgi:hypothetical protein